MEWFSERVVILVVLSAVAFKNVDAVDVDSGSKTYEGLNSTTSTTPIPDLSEHVTTNSTPERNSTKNPEVVNGEKSSFLNDVQQLINEYHWPFVGVVTGVVLIILLFCCYCQMRNRRHEDYSQLVKDEIEFRRGGMGKVVFNPGNDKNEMPIFIPYDIRLELRRKDIIMDGTVLGAGAFGKVVKGEIKVEVKGTPKGQIVAVKMLNNNPNYMHFKALLSELKMMSYIGEHENIVKLVGACTESAAFRKMDVLLVFEFCGMGDIYSYIKKGREGFVDLNHNGKYVVDDELTNVHYQNRIETKLNSGHLLRWAYEVANGMDWIASKNVYHGDMAARNMLLDSTLTAKIADFGLAKVVEYRNFYKQTLACPLPLKWMAIESLRDLEFSIESDVWSYGIMLWELFSLGAVPYPGIDWNHEAWKLLSDGYRMEKPSFATEDVYKIMLDCWKTEFKERPRFGELKRRFEDERKKMKYNIKPADSSLSFSQRTALFEKKMKS